MSLVKELSLANMVTAERAFVAGIGVSVAPIIDMVYGADRTHIITLLFALIALDWISGVSASLKDKTYSSAYGISGIGRTIFILLFPALANLIDVAFNTPGFLFYGVTFGIIYHTWQSTTANVARCGWNKWIPNWILEFVGSEIKSKADRAMNRQQTIERKNQMSQGNDKKEEPNDQGKSEE